MSGENDYGCNCQAYGEQCWACAKENDRRDRIRRAKRDLVAAAKVLADDGRESE